MRERDLLLEEGDLVLLVAQRLFPCELTRQFVDPACIPDRGPAFGAVRVDAAALQLLDGPKDRQLLRALGDRRTDQLDLLLEENDLLLAIVERLPGGERAVQAVGLPRGFDVAAGLLAREIDPALPQLLLGSERRQRIAAAGGRGVDQRDLALEQLDLAPLVLRRGERLAAALLGVKAAVGVAQAVDDAGQRLARLALGQRLGGEQGPQCLLDLHGFAGRARDERTGRDGLVRPALRLGLGREVDDLLRAGGCRLGHTFPERLSGAGLRVDPLARRLDERELPGLGALGRFRAAKRRLGEPERCPDRDLVCGGQLIGRARRALDGRPVGCDHLRDAAVRGLDLADVGELGPCERIVEGGPQRALLPDEPLQLAPARRHVAGDLARAHRQLVRPRLGRDLAGPLLLRPKLRLELTDAALDAGQRQRDEAGSPPVLLQPVALEAEEVQLLGRRAAGDGAVDGTAHGVVGVRGLPGDALPGAPEGVRGGLGVGQRRLQRGEDDPLRLAPVVLLGEGPDVLAGAVVEERQPAIQLVGAADRVGQRLRELLGGGLCLDADRDGIVAGDRDRPAHLLRADLAGAQERDLHVARGRDRDLAGLGRALRDPLQLAGGRARRASDPGQRRLDGPGRGVVRGPGCREPGDRNRHAGDHATHHADR